MGAGEARPNSEAGAQDELKIVVSAKQHLLQPQADSLTLNA